MNNNLLALSLAACVLVSGCQDDGPCALQGVYHFHAETGCEAGEDVTFELSDREELLWSICGGPPSGGVSCAYQYIERTEIRGCEVRFHFQHFSTPPTFTGSFTIDPDTMTGTGTLTSESRICISNDDPIVVTYTPPTGS